MVWRLPKALFQHRHQVHYVRIPWRRHVSFGVEAFAPQLGVDQRPQARLVAVFQVTRIIRPACR
jgi:hypothetical protein